MQYIVLEGENFCNGWCILPVLIEKEKVYQNSFENGFSDYPEMRQYSQGRYLYSGNKLTGLNPVSEINLEKAGTYNLWARSKYYSSDQKGTYHIEIEDWKSDAFGGNTNKSDDIWQWQKSLLNITNSGRKVVRLIDITPEACCDVIILTNDLDYCPEGLSNIPDCKNNVNCVTIPYILCDACEQERLEKVKVQEIKHGKTASFASFLGDIDLDGKDELIVVQEDELLQAFKPDGTLLWKTKISLLWQNVNKINYHKEGYKYYLPHDFYLGRHPFYGNIIDINKDGRNEFIFGWNPIYIIDGISGKIIKERQFPGQAAKLKTADLSGNGEKTELYVTVKDAVEGKAYVFAVDANLDTIWMIRIDGPDMEHSLAVGDIDADGKDEVVFTCYNNLYCIDDDGSVLWIKEGRAAWGGLDYHSDKILIEDFSMQSNNDNVIILAEGEIFNPDGSIRWCPDKNLNYENADYFDEYHGKMIESRNLYRAFDHGQMVSVIKFRNDYPGKQILFGERNIGNVYCFSSSGELIWKRGRYHGQRTHVSDIVPINWSGRGKKEVLCRYLGIFDESGNLIAYPPYIEGGASSLSVADMTGNNVDDIITTHIDTTYIISNLK